MSNLCIYHGNCADGFTAAWVVRKYYSSSFGKVDFYAGTYGEDPPDVTGKDVILVDFSYKKPVIEEMRKKALSILILDHHKSAYEDLKDYPSVRNLGEYLKTPMKKNEVITCFDMERSGAGIAWDFFFPDKRRPKLIDHIEDRDLWLFRLRNTREVQACVLSYPYTFEDWDFLMETSVSDLAAEGEAIERKHHKDVAELVKVMKRTMVIGGIRVPVANLPYTYTSDAGHMMSEGVPFAACYWDTPTGRVVSLRSQDDGMDVSKIAQKYGGGGHEHAAGFTVPIGWEGDQCEKVCGTCVKYARLSGADKGFCREEKMIGLGMMAPDFYCPYWDQED